MSQPPYQPGDPGPPPPGSPPPPPYYPPVYPPQGPPPFSPPPRRGLSPLALVLIIVAGCGVVGLIGVAVLGAVMFPVFAQAREATRATTCRSNLKQLSTAMLLYAQDYDDRLPPSQEWLTVTYPYYKISSVGNCPTATSPGGYAFNTWMSGREMNRVPVRSAQPLLFDSSSPTGPSAADALQSFAPRHRQQGNVAYADGSVRAESAAPAADAGLRGQ